MYTLLYTGSSLLSLRRKLCVSTTITKLISVQELKKIKTKVYEGRCSGDITLYDQVKPFQKLSRRDQEI